MQKTTQHSMRNEILQLQSQVDRLQKTLQERKERLMYFVEEGLPDKIIRAALTNVEQTEMEIRGLEEKLTRLRLAARFSSGFRWN